MTGEALSYLGLCVGAVVLAAHAPRRQRRAAVLLALVLLADWLVCEWTYAAASPQAMLRSWGLSTGATEIWAAADMVLAVSALSLGRCVWWGWAIWALALAQEYAHVLRPLTGDYAYLWTLDKLLLAQVAVFVVVGGHGVSNRLSGLCGFRRLGSHARRAS